MGDGFPRRPVSALAVNLDGARTPVRARDRRPGPYPYYGASGVIDHVDGYLFEGLHLLVAEDGENLRSRKTPVAFLADGRFWVNNHAHVLRGSDVADTRFLAYAIEAADISGYLTGSTQPKLTQAALNRIEVPAPSIEEQRAIAEVVGALDDKIESNRRRADIAESLLDVLVVAVAGPDVVPLRELVQVDRASCTPASAGATLVDHFSLPAFDAARLPDRTAGGSIKSNKLVVDSESVLVSRLNPGTNRTWFAVPEPGVLAAASTEFMVLRPGSRVGLGGLWLAVRDEFFRSELARRATGTSGSHQRVRPDDMLSIEVPDVRALAAAQDAEAEGLLRLVHQARTESATLAELRDALLPELLSGRLRVPLAEDLVGAAR